MEDNGLIYGLEERPPLKDTLFAALQHLLAIFVAIITPPLIVAGALGLDIQTTSYLVSMSLFVSGIATFVQCRKVGPAGCGLLCVQGTSFSFISPIIMAGAIGGLPAIFGATMVGALAEVFISRILKYAMKIITPLVSGIVVTLIGQSSDHSGTENCRQSAYGPGHYDRTDERKACSLDAKKPTSCRSDLPALDEGRYT